MMTSSELNASSMPLTRCWTAVCVCGLERFYTVVVFWTTTELVWRPFSRTSWVVRYES